MLKILSYSFLIYTSSLFAGVEFKDLDKNIHKNIINYTHLHKKFFKQSCSQGEDRKYFELLKKYRGQGYYLPKYRDDIDRQAIKSNLHFFQKKISYIQELKSKLKKQKEFPKFSYISLELKKSLDTLLEYKKEYHLELLEVNRKEIAKKSRREIIAFKNKFKVFINQIYFLKSFSFPNDFMNTRREYEEAKVDGEKKLANKLYFKRKIVEDGTYLKDKTRPDKFLRSTIDTLYLTVKNEKDFISENVRHDLEWIFSGVKSYLKKGKKVQLERLSEWETRTKEAHRFYKDIIKTKRKNLVKKLIQDENEATHELQDFVYSQQAKVYEFWAKQSELNKALYVLETILVNEVGVLDGKYGIERYEVAQVVIKRFYDSFYSQLDKKQKIIEFINPEINTKKEKWLNTLFRVGEFSFTYHYISAVSQIFCPDMSRRGKNIRQDNLKISLKALKNYSEDFEALRYFSRVSMLGKIDMSVVWTDYARLPEKVGYESENQRRLTRYYLADKYRYLYSFLDSKNIEYFVIEIENKRYSQRWIKGRPVFFDYRSPHLFSYFKRID